MQVGGEVRHTTCIESGLLVMPVPLGPAFYPAASLLGIHASSLATVARQLLDRLIDVGAVPAGARDAVLQGIAARESTGSTAIGGGLAVPHAYLESVPHTAVAMARLDPPCDFAALDGTPTEFVFLSVGPTTDIEGHLVRLSMMAELLSDPAHKSRLKSANSPEEVQAAIASLDA